MFPIFFFKRKFKKSILKHIKGHVVVVSIDLARGASLIYKSTLLNLYLFNNVEDIGIFLAYKMFNSDNLLLSFCSRNVQVTL